ncbi:LAMI_0E06326g1_1 [Lachancea mirantina]|uniref:DNA polymerase n=1 Tax=Lachancea mirantina TaxID=1230905 RepID=A0A1G4JLT6_9SACH|nr:LAMI_0E06326g1_1 [Lachancea mirantina]
MGLFQGFDFLILPSKSPARVQFFVQLIQNNQGTVKDGFTTGTIILVNDSFVSDNGHINKLDIFQSEWHYDDNVWYDIIECRELKCYSLSWVSECLKNGEIAQNPRFEVTLPGRELINLASDESDQESVEMERSYSGNIPKLHDSHGDSDAETDVEAKSDVTDQAFASRHADTSEFGSVGKQIAIDTTGGLNGTLITALEQLAEKYRLKGDVYRSRGYQLAVQSIRAYHKRLESGDEAASLPNIGSSIASKIQTLLSTGLLPGLEESKTTERQLHYFMNCHGVGSHTAMKWTQLGAKTFRDAFQLSPSDFNWSVLYGWRYFNDWHVRIPRDECDKHLIFIKDSLREVDKTVQIEQTGSYRRGSKTCGDIDTVMWKPGCDDILELSHILEKLVENLYNRGYIKCPLNLNWRLGEIFESNVEKLLAMAGSNSTFIKTPKVSLRRFYFGGRLPAGESLDHGTEADALKYEDLYMSDSNATNRCRRVDILTSKWSELGSTMIYFTGNDDFNKSLRLRANNKGWKLNHHGLFQRLNDRSGDKTLIESFDEKRIIELLGVKYVPPFERNIEGYI